MRNDREKALSHIGILRSWCAVNPDYGQGLSVEDCRKAVERLDKAIEILNTQAPRVLTLEELNNCDVGVPLWLDTQDLCYYAWTTFRSSNVEYMILFYGDDEESWTQLLPMEDYGKTWRCWNGRPTWKLREATAWSS